MIRYLVAAGLACASLAAPASAQERWRHEASGVSVPRQVGEMRLSGEQDASGGSNTDVIVQFGDAETAVTLYVYRSAYPNAALWFERTRLAMNEHVGAGERDAAPRSFTLGGAPSPNGLREEIALSGGRATGVAIAQIGEWMVKARITSARLDVAGVTRRMDELLGALQFAQPPAAALPLVVPGPCRDETRRSGNLIRNPQSEGIAAAALFGIVGYGEARGHGGLAAEPQSWCRETGGRLPVRFGTVYRRIDGTAWVALLADSGRAIAAGPVDLPGRFRAALYVSTPTSTQVAALYDGTPDPDPAIELGIPIAVGMARGLTEIRMGNDREQWPQGTKN